MFSSQQRLQYNGLMSTTGRVTLRTGTGANDKIVMNLSQVPRFLADNFPGFRDEWARFMTDTSTLRVHKQLERADLDNDTETFNRLLEGRHPDGTVDNDLKEFLVYHVSHAQICWRHICNAEGCSRPASKKCGQCKCATYCSKECQTSDWRQSHKFSCRDLIGYKQ